MNDTSPQATRIRLRTQSAEETARVGEVIGSLEPAPVVIAIEGELGAGKTQLVRGLAAGLGLDAAEVSSPTFVLSCRHDGPNCSLAHLDAYRMSGDDDLESIGFEEMLGEPSLVMAIEWASRLQHALPANRIEIRIAHLPADERAIEIMDHRDSARLRERLSDALQVRCDATETPLIDTNTCPSCGEKSTDSEHGAFCSHRCRMADLGNWLGGRYSISRPLHADEELSD